MGNINLRVLLENGDGHDRFDDNNGGHATVMKNHDVLLNYESGA